MRLTAFRAEQVHGYLDLKVQFRPDLTFLTGSNGSGKTTVVRGLVSLLRPSFRSLAGLAYRSMDVVLNHEGQDFTIGAQRSEGEFSLMVSGVEAPLRVPIFKQGEYEPPSRFQEREADFYRDKHTELSGHPVLEFLNELPTPLFLDLERRGGEPLRRQRFRLTRAVLRPARNPYSGALGEGLAEAQQVAELSYEGFLSQERRLSERLGRDLILTAFIQSQTSGGAEQLRLPTSDYVNNLRNDEELVASALVNLGIRADSVTQSVGGFFSTLGTVASALVGRNLDSLLDSSDADDFEVLSRWIAIQPQERQIRRIVELVQKYNHRVESLRAPLTRYLAVVNRFLEDSGKKLAFSDAGHLVATLPGGSEHSITGLSSGERQLVVILTHLALGQNATSADILIIDEPELSLHVRWQEAFVDSLLAARENVQLILATHSPSIVLDRFENCVEVVGVSE